MQIVASRSRVRATQISRRQLDASAQPAAIWGDECELPVVGLHDARRDRQAETEAGVVTADASCAALERLAPVADGSL